MDAVQPAMHGRDHCPGGTDPIPCFPAIQIFRAANTVGVTVPGTSQIVVDWDEWQMSEPTSVPLAFTPLDTALAPADPGDVVRRVQLELDGRYTFTFCAHNSSDIAGTVEMAMHDGDPIWGRPQSTLHGPCTSLSPGFYVHAFSQVYPLFDPFGSGGHTPQVSLTLAQNGGSSEVFSEVLMEIQYESTPVHYPPAS